MREIKFRTWDTEYKEFSEWTNRDPFFDTSNGKIFFWERKQKEDGSYDGDIILQDLGNRFILQQYTGFKDKNGKEIYEGDIVSLFNSKDPEETYEIVWEDDECRFALVSEGGYGDFFKPRDREVIGNIFQNSELLKQ